MPALLYSSVELKRTKHRAVSVISLHEKRKLNPDGRYRVGQLLVRYQIGQTDTESERERDRDREAPVLVRSPLLPARFVPREIYKR